MIGPNNIGVAASRRPRLSAILAIASLAGVAIYFFDQNHVRQNPRTRLAQALAAAPYRMVEGRLSVAQDWKPFRSDSSTTSAAALRVRSAAAEMAIAGTQRDAESLHDRLLAALLTTSATADLQNVLVNGPSSDQEMWNDAAVAFLQRAEQTKNAAVLVDALWANDRALRIAPHDAPALFNRALILDGLGLHRMARRVWISYLRVERDALWADEALMRLNHISARNTEAEWRRVFASLQSTEGEEQGRRVAVAVAAYPQYARRWGENVVLGNWADAILSNDPSLAARHLTLARRIGDAIERHEGDSMLRQVVDGIEKAKGEHGRRLLAAAMVTYRAGRLAHNANREREAERQLRRAESEFAAFHSPLTLTARYYVASALDAQWRTREAAAALDALAAQHLESGGYRALAAQLGWERGSSFLREGLVSNALDSFSASRDAFTKLHELDFAAAMEGEVAIVLDWAGDARAAWTSRVRALDQLSRSGDYWARIVVVLEEAAQTATSRHEWNRAEALRSLTCALAEDTGNAAVAAYAWSSRAVVACERNDDATALRSIAAARVWAKRLLDPNVRVRADADLAYAEGMLLRKSAPPRALQKFDQALTLYARAQNRAEMPSIRLARARLERRMTMLPAAQNDVDEGLRIVRQERRELRDPEKRTTLVESANALFDEAIALALERGDADRAFELADEQRGRALADRFTLGSAADLAETPPWSARAIRERLSPGTAVVEFASLPDRLVTFVVRKERLQVFISPLSMERVAALLDQFRGVTRRRDAAALQTCSNAYGAILAEAGPALEGIRQIAFVADERFGNAPFGALYDSWRGEFLAERAKVLLAPSATLLVTASQRSRTRGGHSVIAVGADRFDRLRFPDAQPLAAVDEEANVVAASYTPSAVLCGGEATRPNVMRAIASHAIAHIAGHSVVVGAAGIEPALLFAPAQNDHGVWRASEIARQRFDGTRLVTLAACRSATAPERNDGTGSVALAFLAAGVPTVVATLDDLGDRDSRPLMAAFHRRVAQGDEPAAALSDAVRLTVRDDQHHIRFPLAWANVVVIGGSGDFVLR